DETREISDAVFTYFRWRGFLTSEKPLEDQMREAWKLAAQFRKEPASLSPDSLRAKVVPDWINAEVDAADDWFRTLQQPPNLWIRAKRGQGNALADTLLPSVSGPLADSVLYKGTEDLFRTPEFHAGEFELQDISSQAVGFVCDPKPG